MSVISGAARAVALVGGGLSALFVIWAGFQWMTASGDPQKMAQARMSLIGTVVGICIMGIGFMIPGVISEFVIEPAGGIAIESEVGVNCDGILRTRLVVYRVASTPSGMNSLVRQVQGQVDECDSSVWDPLVRVTAIGLPLTDNKCANDPATAQNVGGLDIPGSFKESGGALEDISQRDSRNNILVYWTLGTTPDNSRQPSDGSFCWLYNQLFDSWSEGYE